MAATDPTSAQHWLDSLLETDQQAGVTSRAGVRQRQARALAGYAVSFNATAAARMAGVARQRVHRWRTEDPIFAAAWREAEASVTDTVLGELFERAVHGHEVVVRDRNGNQVATERRPSDRLLVALVRGLDPARFGVQQVGPHRQDEDGWRQHFARIADDPEALAALETLADRLVGEPVAVSGERVIVPQLPPPAEQPQPARPTKSPEQQSIEDRLRGGPGRDLPF